MAFNRPILDCRGVAWHIPDSVQRTVRFVIAAGLVRPQALVEEGEGERRGHKQGLPAQE